MSKTIRTIVIAVAVCAGASAHGAGPEPSDDFVFGVKLSIGGRYDDVRMCVASDAGVKGGPAADISFFMEFGLSDRAALSVNIPVMRPILFGVAFDMLQFEPDVTLVFKKNVGEELDVVGGPMLGLSLHYGPDYRSANDGNGRLPSFFAMGPRVGGYFGLDFLRPGKSFNFQLGLTAYFEPLFGIDDPDDHQGIVAGGTLEGLFRFR